MPSRSKARELAFQMLYLIDLNPDLDGPTIQGMIEERIDDTELVQFSWKLFAGVMEHRDQIDEQISEIAENWSLSRMAATDRNLLRMGSFELSHLDTPPKVVIDEAIDLAKKFGSKNSSSFVNGLLDRLQK